MNAICSLNRLPVGGLNHCPDLYLSQNLFDSSKNASDQLEPQAGFCAVCRVPSTLRPILGTSTAPKDELYSEQDMHTALLSYAAGNDLQHSNDSLKLDKLMVSNLFNKKEPQMEGDACPLEDVMKRLLGRHTTCACSLVKPPWHVYDTEQQVYVP